MKTLRPYGFFSDLTFGDPTAPKLRACLDDKPVGENVQRVARYLRAGVQFSVVPMLVHDIIAEERSAIGPLRYLTDGEWVWRSDLPYYVEKYHCRIPSEFITHMKSRDWIPPADVDLSQIKMPFEENA